MRRGSQRPHMHVEFVGQDLQWYLVTQRALHRERVLPFNESIAANSASGICLYACGFVRTRQRCFMAGIDITGLGGRSNSGNGIVKLTKTASGQPPGIAVGAAANTTNCAAVRRSFVNLTMPNSHLGLLRPERCEVDTTQSTRAVVRPTG